MEVLGDVLYWMLVLIRLEIVLMIISTHDRCKVCIGHAIVSEIVMGAPDGTPR
jgi:hypothetical protein